MVGTAALSAVELYEINTRPFSKSEYRGGKFNGGFTLLAIPVVYTAMKRYSSGVIRSSYDTNGDKVRVCGMLFVVIYERVLE